MKLRYHLLMLLVAAGTVVGVWQWLTLPLWKATALETVEYSGRNTARKELYSLISENGGQLWSMETRDYRTGKISGKLPLEISPGKVSRRWLYNPESCFLAESVLVYVEYEKHAESASFRTRLLDGATGRCLPHGVFSKRLISSQVAYHAHNLALAWENEIWLYRNKLDAGKKISLGGVKQLQFSKDGTWLVCFDGLSSIAMVECDTGEIIQPLGFEMKVIHFDILANGQIVTISYQDIPGTVNTAGINVIRWQRDGKKFRQVGAPTLLRGSHPLDLPISSATIRESNDGKLIVSLFQGEGWIEGLESMFSWLTRLGVPVERLFPMKPYSTRIELDDQNQEVNRYRKFLEGVLTLDDDLALRCLPTLLESKSIEVIRTRPAWPWACGMGLSVYVTGWMLCRRLTCRRNKQAIGKVKSSLVV